MVLWLASAARRMSEAWAALVRQVEPGVARGSGVVAAGGVHATPFSCTPNVRTRGGSVNAWGAISPPAIADYKEARRARRTRKDLITERWDRRCRRSFLRGLDLSAGGDAPCEFLAAHVPQGFSVGNLHRLIERQVVHVLEPLGDRLGGFGATARSATAAAASFVPRPATGSPS